MNTVKKGNYFEAKSLKIIKRVIEEERLGVNGKYIKIYSKKGYFSQNRQSEIIFDLAIEVWPKDSTRFSLLYLIECKNYKDKVPVGDIEEFHKKIEQVAGVNVKGVFITNKGFQEGTYNYAQSVGMMLILAGTADNFEILFHKRTIQVLKNNQKIGDECIDQKSADPTVEQITQAIDSKLSIALLSPISTLSKEQIETIAVEELNKINPLIMGYARPLSVSRLESYITDSLGINIQNLERNSDFLGAYSVKNNTIYIHPSIVGSNRHLFVLAHELGHYKLHRDISIDQDSYDNFSDPNYNFRTNKYEFSNPKHWIEWQANCFASSLVLPKVPLIVRLNMYQNDQNVSNGIIYLDDQIQNWNNYNQLITKLAYYFSVSKTSVIYKLQALGFVNNKSRLRAIGQIIEEYKSDLFM